MASYKRKRFIAGAVCPACGVEDKVFVASDEAGEYRGCTQCDFRELLADAVSGDAGSGEAVEAVQVVRLVDPEKR